MDENKKGVYSIDVSLEPHFWDNKHKPYFWVIFETHADGVKTNEGCGWAVSPQIAWEDAMDYYNNFISKREKNI